MSHDKWYNQKKGGHQHVIVVHKRRKNEIGKVASQYKESEIRSAACRTAVPAFDTYFN